MSLLFNNNNPYFFLQCSLKVHSYIDNIISQLKEALNGSENQQNILTKFGIATFKLIADHIKSFKYSCMGAAQLHCDLKEYQQLALLFNDSKIVKLFDSLSSLSVLLLVAPENLNSVIEDDQLKMFDSNTINSIKRLRLD